MNLANKLTIFRMILVLVMVIIALINPQGNLWGIPLTFIFMDVVFIVASITDKLDGYIARSRNQITTFGKFLDPIADKILVLTAMIYLVGFGKIPAWIPVIVMFREFLVSGYRLVACEKGGKVIAASVWGKLKTVTQMVALVLVFVDKYSYGYFISNPIENTGLKVLNIITFALLTISVIATIFSGYDYIKGGKDLFKEEAK